MKIKNIKKISTMALLVQGVLITQSAAFAVEKNVEITGLGVTHKSAKFGEYTGLSDTNVDGNFEILSGYSKEDQDSENTSRWSVVGKDLGTTSRSVNAAVSNQGKWKLSAGFDELRHNISDSYQTPLVGAMGGNSFTLPTSFGTVNGTTTPGAQPTTRALDANQLSMIHSQSVGTTRSNSSFGSTYIVNDHVDVQFAFNHLEQSGAKLVGSGSQGGINTPNQTGPGATVDTWKAEAVFILMNPTKYKTDTFDLSTNWKNDNGHLTASYFGSIFRDGFNSVSWENNETNAVGDGSKKTGYCASGGGVVCTYEYNSMSTAPNNDYHQVGLQGGYNLPFSTKVASSVSYGIGTQKDSYLSGDLPEVTNAGATTVQTMQTNGLPAQNLAGKIIQTHGDVKFTNTSFDKLQLNAGFKYNRRENESPSKYYKYYNLGGTAASKQYTGINNPYSNYRSETELSGDYRLTSAQKVRLSWETDKYKRWCDNAAHGLECVGSTGSFENRVKLDYRLKATDDLHFNAGYTYGKRTVEDVAHYMTPIGSEATIQSAQMDGKDILGFVSLPFAARNEHIVKLGSTWEFNEKLDFSLNGSLTRDHFESTIGVQKMDNNYASVDGSYAINENNSVTSYLSYQAGERTMHNANDGDTTTLPTNFWDNETKDTSSSLGVSTKHSGLMGGKMEITSDLAYSIDQTKISTQVPYDPTNCALSTNLSCGDLQPIKDTRITFKITDSYQLNSNSKVTLGYIFEKRKVEDYYYNGYQNGNTPLRIMPDGEQAPTYTVSLIAASYSYMF